MSIRKLDLSEIVKQTDALRKCLVVIDCGQHNIIMKYHGSGSWKEQANIACGTENKSNAIVFSQYTVDGGVQNRPADTPNAPSHQSNSPDSGMVIVNETITYSGPTDAVEECRNYRQGGRKVSQPIPTPPEVPAPSISKVTVHLLDSGNVPGVSSANHLETPIGPRDSLFIDLKKAPAESLPERDDSSDPKSPRGKNNMTGRRPVTVGKNIVDYVQRKLGRFIARNMEGERKGSLLSKFIEFLIRLILRLLASLFGRSA